jgi:DNA-binding MarR family transcriptional regulator
MKNPDHKLTRQRARHLLEKDDAKVSMYISDIARLFDGTVSAAVERKGMSRGYRQILFHLAHEDGVTQLSLAKLTHLSAPTVSVALGKMEQAGLVIRKADKDDLRQVKVFLTESGRKQDEFIREKSDETEEKMLEGIGEEEREQLVNTLRKILINMLDEENPKEKDKKEE